MSTGAFLVATVLTGAVDPVGGVDSVGVAVAGVHFDMKSYFCLVIGAIKRKLTLCYVRVFTRSSHGIANYV